MKWCPCNPLTKSKRDVLLAELTMQRISVVSVIIIGFANKSLNQTFAAKNVHVCEYHTLEAVLPGYPCLITALVLNVQIIIRHKRHIKCKISSVKLLPLI